MNQDHLWQRYLKTRTVEDRNALVVAYVPHLRVVADALKQKLPNHVRGDDLVAGGVPGLMEAAGCTYMADCLEAYLKGADPKLPVDWKPPAEILKGVKTPRKESKERVARPSSTGSESRAPVPAFRKGGLTMAVEAVVRGGGSDGWTASWVVESMSQQAGEAFETQFGKKSSTPVQRVAQSMIYLRNRGLVRKIAPGLYGPLEVAAGSNGGEEAPVTP